MKFYKQHEMQVAPTLANHLIRKTDLDARFAEFDFQADVLDIQVDNTLDPGATPTTGDRYIVADVANLHANFGTITGVGDDDIVQYDGTNFVVVFDVSVAGIGAMVWDIDSGDFYKLTSSGWISFTVATHSYGADFLTTDWAGASAPYSITVSAVTHGLGTTDKLITAVYDDATPHNLIGCDVTVSAGGDVVLLTDVKVNGSYVIMV